MKRRTRFLVALVALTSVLGLATVGSAGATTNVAGDSSFDNGSGYDGRGDITTFGGDYRDNLITLSVSARIPTDPATDSNWINYNAAVIWSLDTNGDGNEDYWAIITNFLGVVSHVYRSSDNTQLCSASPTFDAPSGLIFTHFDASCIGTPSGFTIQAYFTYETASTDSVDFAPSASGFWAVKVSLL